VNEFYRWENGEISAKRVENRAFSWGLHITTQVRVGARFRLTSDEGFKTKGVLAKVGAFRSSTHWQKKEKEQSKNGTIKQKRKKKLVRSKSISTMVLGKGKGCLYTDSRRQKRKAGKRVTERLEKRKNNRVYRGATI